MAYTTRTKDPKFQHRMQSGIRKRARQLLGVILVLIGGFLGYALIDYAPNDPSLLTDASAGLSVDQISASLSALLVPTVGLASWGLVLACLVWGVRLILSLGEERAVSRSIFVPIFIVLLAIFLSTNEKFSFWTYSWGMGGVSGDAITESLLNFSPIDLTAWARLVSLGLGLLTLALGFFSLGFSMAELVAIFKRGMRGTLVALLALYAGVKSLLKFGSRGAKAGSETVAQARKQMRERKHLKDGMPIIRTEDRIDEDARSPKTMGRNTVFTAKPVFGGKRQEVSQKADLEEQPRAEKKKFKIPSLAARNPDPVMEVGPQVTSQINDDRDRVSSRIRDVIRKKMDEGGRLEDEIAPVTREAAFLDAEPDDIEADDIPKKENMFSKQMKRAVNIFADSSKAEDLDPVLPMEAPEAAAPSLPTAPSTVVQHERVITPRQSQQAEAEKQPNLFAEPKKAKDYQPPELNFLSSPSVVQRNYQSDEALEENARMLENVLDDYGVKGEITSVRPGPVVTMYELEPAPGLKASRVIGLSDDIARSMSALAARVSTVPGRTVIGIELPNDHRETVFLREILSTRDFGDGKHSLPLALGKDIAGKPEIADLAKMPHLLIAGTTGSGKSVAINTMIMSLLYKLTPDECRLIMIDPKMLELSVYDDIPHLLSPVVTDPKKAVVALKWAVAEMEERYRKMSKMGVRNISGYNARVQDALDKGDNFERTVQTGFDENTGEPIFETESFAPEKLPFIVVIVDEMADLMMVAGKEIEACIQRLAQMARASGIHLIMATQRPSVDVITGTIKANFPTRISFQVTSKVDSRTILGEMGAEQLLGMGDNLYMAGGGKITRIHAPFVSDEEVEIIVNHLKTFGPPDYVSGVVKGPDDETTGAINEVLGLGGNTTGENALYDQAVQIVAMDRKCSTSYIQRKLSIGYNKAAKLVEEMEENGVVSAANHVGKREILLPETE
ncbi:MAG: DNA translocase FtsK 4TM domain-containing protein [Pseudomonadota bacterium]